MGNSPQDSGAARQVTADDSKTELDILEQTISIEGARVLRHDDYGLAASPIPRAWILDGNPVARKKRLAGSSDRLATTVMWDCTAGRFSWFYEDEEVAHVLEGSVVIEDTAGARQRLQAGDTFLFPAGSQYLWMVPNYVRKIAFSYPPLSPAMRLVRGALKRLTAPFRPKPAGGAAWDG